MVEATNINYYNNVQLKAQRPDYSNGQPQLMPQVMEGAQDTYVAQRAEKVEKTWITIPATVLAWFGICKGTDYFNNKLMSKEYEETPFAKLGAFGDKVTDGYRNSKFAQSNFGKWLHKARTNTKVFFRDRVVGKNKVLSSIRDNPTIPEWSMPYTESKGLLGKHSIDMKQLLEGFIADPASADHLERVGYTKQEIAGFKQQMKGMAKKDRLAFLQKLECKKLDNCSIAELPNKRAQALGFKDAETLKGMLTKIDDHGKEILDALKNSKNGICFVQEAGEGFLGFLRKLLFKRKVTIKEEVNKYRLVLNEGTAKSKLGRILSKSGAWFMEGATNRFAGGKMVALMQAIFVAQAFSAAVNKGEGFGDKVKTFIERFNELVSYIFSAALGVFGLYHVAGMKYAGMNKEEVAKYREKIKEFNADVLNGKYDGNKKAYKEAWAKVEKLRFKDNKFFTRMFQRLGGFLNTGNEQREVYRAAKGTMNLNWLRKFGHWTAKTPLSFIIRGLPVMMVIIPFIAKVTTKCSNAIFGKPKHSLLDEEKEEAEAKKAEQLQAQMTALQQDAQARQQASAQYEHQMANNNQNMPRMDLLQQYKQQQMAQQQAPVELPAQTVQSVPQEPTTVVNNNNPNRSYIPSSKGVEVKPEYTYIPATNAVQIQAPDYSKAEDALQKSVAIENEVMRVLGQR